MWIGKSGWKDWELKRVLLDEYWVLVTKNSEDSAGRGRRQGLKASMHKYHSTPGLFASMVLSAWTSRSKENSSPKRLTNSM